MGQHFDDLLEGTDQPAQLLRLDSGRLVYYYKAYRNGGVVCSFSLLCEVGGWYSKPFIDKIRELVKGGWSFETRELDQHPHMADYLVRPGEAAHDGFYVQPANWQLSRSVKEWEPAVTNEQKEFERLYNSVAGDSRAVQTM